ncbi:MAG: hypothetical protein F6K48_31945 [Okeania sp. SIO3H1]|nr:hypothetical protein [Okeania sp. SIO3H1]
MAPKPALSDHRPREKKFSFDSILFLLGRGNYQLSMINYQLLKETLEAFLTSISDNFFCGVAEARV